jgi:glycosyltransferase involved in cell wall biosynthesis
MKNILFITYHFPPVSSSTSVMNFQIANFLGKNFNVYVLTVRPNESNQDNNLLNRLNINVNIIRTEMGYLHQKNFKMETSEKKQVGFIKKIKKKARQVALRFKEVVLIPDPVIDWYFIAVKCIKSMIENISPDYIISSATPYTSHLVGYKLSKLYDIPLILYYGDPWVYEQSRKRGILRFNMEKTIEEKILKHAIKVYTVTETTKQLYIEKYNLDPFKVDVIRLGFDPIDYKYSDCCSNSKLTMLYGGALNPIHRNPMPFFEALLMLRKEIQDDLYFKLYSNESNKYKEIVRKMGLMNIIEVRSVIAYEEFIDQLETCDLLILFGNSSFLQVPGKVYDYIGSLSKILLINNMENYKKDPTFKILTSYGGNYYCKNEVKEIQNMLEAIHQQWKTSGLQKNKLSDVEQFTWDNSISKLNRFIEEN